MAETIISNNFQEEENNISSSNLISNILKNDTEEFKNELTNLLNDNFNGFINRIKVKTEQIIEDKIVKFYNGKNDNIYDILFNEDGKQYIDKAIKFLKTNSNKKKQEEILRLQVNSNKCFSITSITYSPIMCNSSDENYLTIIFFENIIILEYHHNYSSYGNGGSKNTRYDIIKNIIPLNSMLLIKNLIENCNERTNSSCNNKYYYFKFNIEEFLKQMEENPQHFVNNCMEFENLCNEEKQNYMNKMNMLENERKEIEIIKQECNEKIEIYHKLQSEYDEFQMEKQKLAEEKKKLQLVKFKLEEMKHKLDEEREEFEKQKELLNSSEIDLDSILN
jgi:hypothetical protein